jgi:hypothetical protein
LQHLAALVSHYEQHAHHTLDADEHPDDGKGLGLIEFLVDHFCGNSQDDSQHGELPLHHAASVQAPMVCSVATTSNMAEPPTSFACGVQLEPTPYADHQPPPVFQPPRG